MTRFATAVSLPVAGRAASAGERRAGRDLAGFRVRFPGHRRTGPARRSGPFRPVTIRAVYADDDTVIVIWDGRGIANDGQPYENSYAWIMKLADGKVIDGTAFYDSISFNDLWARVRPR
jgi:SnoaL-like protein